MVISVMLVLIYHRHYTHGSMKTLILVILSTNVELCDAKVNKCDIVQTRQTAYRPKALTSKKTIPHRFVKFLKNLGFVEPQRHEFWDGGSMLL